MEETKDPDIELWEEINNLKDQCNKQNQSIKEAFINEGDLRYKMIEVAANSPHFKHCMGNLYKIKNEKFIEELESYINKHMQKGMNEKTGRILEDTTDKMAKLEDDLQQVQQDIGDAKYM